MSKNENKRDLEKERDVRRLNITAAQQVADSVRTSLGPRGHDKMIIKDDGDVLITNDGATMLKSVKLLHPCATMLADASKAQDVEAGDGTTSVVVMAGALLKAAAQLLEQGIHPVHIVESFNLSQKRAVEILKGVATPVDLDDKELLMSAVSTTLSSKVVSQNARLLAPMAVDAVSSIAVQQPDGTRRVDLNDINVLTMLGGSVDDTEMLNGLAFKQKASKSAGGPGKVSNAKIALIQFQLSPPKTDMENNVVITDYHAMDRLLKEEREYLLKMCKTIQKSGCNVLLIQKSILRDATTDTSLHFLAKMKILVIRDVERNQVEFVCKTLGCKPIAGIESFSADKFGFAERVEEVGSGEGKLVKITGVKNPKTISVIVRGATQLLVDEAERSLHDALCVVRSLMKQPYILVGGGAPEIELCYQLRKYARTLTGVAAKCVAAYADACEAIPYTLAENAGMKPVETVTELYSRHANGEKQASVNVVKGQILKDGGVDVPLLVYTSFFKLATEATNAIVKIDDIVPTR